MNYYPRHLGDYAKDTGHLTMAEHGAYTLLLDHYYSSEKGIPDKLCERIAKAFSDPEKEALRGVLDQFFVKRGNLWINKRADYEISKKQGKSQKAKDSAAARWDSERNANALPTHDSGNADAMLTNNQEPIANSQEPRSNNTSPPPAGDGEPAGDRPKRSARKKVGPDEEAVQAACRETWRAYHAAIVKRYGAPPIRNAPVNAHIRRIVALLGRKEAPQVVAFYVTTEDRFYVQKTHDIGLAVKDAASLRLRWVTGAAGPAVPTMNGNGQQVVEPQRTAWKPEDL